MSSDTVEVRDGLTHAVAVVDTAELRWFASGTAPEQIMTWFTSDGTAGTVEERCDTYRLDGQADVGVKLRFGHTLEMKQRWSVGERCALTPLLASPIEHWRRWSPAESVVEQTGQRWVNVTKRVVKRRFSFAGDELVASPDLPASGGCDVELTEITVGDLQAWSFALAAFGPFASPSAALIDGWNRLASASHPDGFAASLVTACGYPEWLAETLDSRNFGG